MGARLPIEAAVEYSNSEIFHERGIVQKVSVIMKILLKVVEVVIQAHLRI